MVINKLQVDCLKRNVEKHLQDHLDRIAKVRDSGFREAYTDAEYELAKLWDEYNAFNYTFWDKQMIKWGRKVDERSELVGKITNCNEIQHRCSRNLRSHHTINIDVMAGIKAEIDSLILNGYDLPLSAFLDGFKVRIDDAVTAYEKENIQENKLT